MLEEGISTVEHLHNIYCKANTSRIKQVPPSLQVCSGAAVQLGLQDNVKPLPQRVQLHPNLALTWGAQALDRRCAPHRCALCCP